MDNAEREEMLWGTPQTEIRIRNETIKKQPGLVIFYLSLFLIGFLIAILIEGKNWDMIGFFMMWAGFFMLIMLLVQTWWYKKIFSPEHTGIKGLGGRLILLVILLILFAVLLFGFMYGLVVLKQGVFKI